MASGPATSAEISAFWFDEAAQLQPPARIVDTAWFDVLVNEARSRLHEFCCRCDPRHLAPLRGLRWRIAGRELVFDAHFRDRRDWNWVCATPRAFDQRLFECSGFERICMEIVECYIDEFHARRPRWHLVDELIAHARWRIERGNDVIRPGVVFRGVDHGREDSYTVRTVRVGELDAFEFVETFNVTAAEVNEAQLVYQRQMTEQVAQAYRFNYGETAPATTLRVEDLRRAMRTLREHDIDESAAVGYQRHIEALMRRERENFAAYGIAQGFIPFTGRERDAQAEARGQKLLRELLSPAQLKQYDERCAFDVVGRETGTRYRITNGTSHNVLELDAKGNTVCSLCFAPEGELAIGDVMLAQKVALETNERAALKVANRSPAAMDLRPGGINYVMHTNPEPRPGWVQQLFGFPGT